MARAFAWANPSGIEEAFMSMTLDALPERPSYIRDADQWEAACARNGTIMLPRGLCNYHGEVPGTP